MAFNMKCPKCGSETFSITRDERTYSQMDEVFQLVFSCRCGKQMFGQSVIEEYNRQKREWETSRTGTVQADRERLAKERASKKTREALREAFAYRQSYLHERQREIQAAKSRQGDEPWRDRVAPVVASAANSAAKKKAPTYSGGGLSRAAAPTAPVAAAPAAVQPVVVSPVVIEPTSEAVPAEEMCAWPGCGKRRRPRSKYCSRACSNKNARARYKARKN